MLSFRAVAGYIIVFCLCLASISNANTVKDVTPTEAYQLIQKATATGTALTILDIRTPPEFLMGHIEHAVLINFFDNDFAERIGALPRDATYLIYCQSGRRSTQAITLIQQLDFSHMYQISTGIAGWQQANLPLVH